MEIGTSVRYPEIIFYAISEVINHFILCSSATKHKLENYELSPM